MPSFYEMNADGTGYSEPVPSNEQEYSIRSDDVIDEIEAESEELSDMSDVEIRLEEANCFKALLNNSLFEEPMSPIAEKVEKRIRDFIRKELKVLLGLSTPPTPVKQVVSSQFSVEEEKILKGLAAKVLSREVQSGRQEPVVAPAPLKPAVVQEPSVNKASMSKPKEAEPKVARTKGRPAKKEAKNAPHMREISVDLPNGTSKKVMVNLQGQSRIPGLGHPPMTPDQISAHMEMEALTSEPKNGMIGLAIAAAKAGINSTTKE
jgi:hypothetical protein